MSGGLPKDRTLTSAEKDTISIYADKYKREQYHYFHRPVASRKLNAITLTGAILADSFAPGKKKRHLCLQKVNITSSIISLLLYFVENIQDIIFFT